MPSPRAGLHRQFLFGGLRIGLYEPVKKLFMGERPPGDAPLYLKIAAGLTTGALAIMVANPTDLVKARRPPVALGMQLAHAAREMRPQTPAFRRISTACLARPMHCFKLRVALAFCLAYMHATLAHMHMQGFRMQSFGPTTSSWCGIDWNAGFAGKRAATHLPACAGAHAGGQHGGAGAGGRCVDGRVRAGRVQGGRRGEALPQRARCLRHHRAARTRAPLFQEPCNREYVWAGCRARASVKPHLLV